MSARPSAVFNMTLINIDAVRACSSVSTSAIQSATLVVTVLILRTTLRTSSPSSSNLRRIVSCSDLTGARLYSTSSSCG